MYGYITKMSKTEITTNIMKRKKIKVFLSESHLSFSAHVQGEVFPLNQTINKIHEAGQALESNIGVWRPFWILLKKLKNAKYKLPGKLHRANMHTANIWK